MKDFKSLVEEYLPEAKIIGAYFARRHRRTGEDMMSAAYLGLCNGVKTLLERRIQDNPRPWIRTYIITSCRSCLRKDFIVSVPETQYRLHLARYGMVPEQLPPSLDSKSNVLDEIEFNELKNLIGEENMELIELMEIFRSKSTQRVNYSRVAKFLKIDRNTLYKRVYAIQDTVLNYFKGVPNESRIPNVG